MTESVSKLPNLPRVKCLAKPPKNFSLKQYLDKVVNRVNTIGVILLKDKYSCILGVIILLCNNPVTLLVRAPDKRGY